MPLTGWLQQCKFILSGSWAGSPCKIRVLAWSGSGEGPLPSLQTSAFSLGPHIAERERESAIEHALWGLFREGTDPSMKGPTP